MPYLLKVAQKEWVKAKKYFKRFPERVKMRKSGRQSPHSFLKIENKLYAMASHTLGQGAFSRVKVVQKENGKNAKVNIRGRGKDTQYSHTELAILRLLYQYKGEAIRQLDAPKDFWKHAAKQKKKALFTKNITYKIMKLVEGRSLNETLNSHPHLTITQKLIIAFKSCEALFKLYQTHRIIHRDIKADNLIVTIKGNNITATFIDFGLSKILSPDQTRYLSKRGAGTDKFRAPEIEKIAADPTAQGEYSHYSDIYALGNTFRALGLSKDLIQKMMHPDPTKRLSLKKVMLAIVKELTTKNPRLDIATLLKVNNLEKPFPRIHAMPPAVSKMIIAGKKVRLRAVIRSQSKEEEQIWVHREKSGKTFLIKHKVKKQDSSSQLSDEEEQVDLKTVRRKSK